MLLPFAGRQGCFVLDCTFSQQEGRWDFMDASDVNFKPTLLFSRDDPPKRYWQVDGKIRGLQPQNLSEMALVERSRKSGKNIVTPQAAREMDDVKLRLRERRLKVYGCKIVPSFHDLKVRGMRGVHHAYPRRERTSL